MKILFIALTLSLTSLSSFASTENYPVTGEQAKLIKQMLQQQLSKMEITCQNKDEQQWFTPSQTLKGYIEGFLMEEDPGVFIENKQPVIAVSLYQSINASVSTQKIILVTTNADFTQIESFHFMDQYFKTYKKAVGTLISPTTINVTELTPVYDMICKKKAD